MFGKIVNEGGDNNRDVSNCSYFPSLVQSTYLPLHHLPTFFFVSKITGTKHYEQPYKIANVK